MPFAESSRLSASAIIAVIAALLGFAAFWANSRRNINRGFFGASLAVAWWLVCIDQIGRSGGDSVFWARMAGLAGAVIFFPIWFIKEAIVGIEVDFWRVLYKGRYLFSACVSLGLVRWFNVTYGGVNVSVVTFVIGVVGLYVWLFSHTVKEIMRASGVKRIELQIVLLGGCATGLAIMLLLVVRRMADLPWLVQGFPLVVLVFYTGTVVAMTASRVFDARQIVFLGIQRVVLLLGVSGVAYAAFTVLDSILEGPLVWISASGMALWASSMIADRLDRVFEFYPQAKAARHATLLAAQREKRIDAMVAAGLPSAPERAKRRRRSALSE